MSGPDGDRKAREVAARLRLAELRGTAASVLLGIASLAAVVGALETSARLLTWRERSRPRTRRSFLEYDADLGWRKASGEDLLLQGESGPVAFRTNAHGLRGPEVGFEKPPAVQRILLLGDSFAEAGTVAEDESIRAVLERRLNGLGCGRYEVLNAGTSGYSTDQEYLFYEHEGARYSADVVVLLFFSNDLQGNTTTRKKPWFELDGDRLVLHGSPVPAPPDEHRRRLPDTPPSLTPWHGSQALRLLGRRTEGSNPPLHRWLARVGLVEPAHDHPPTRDWLRAYGPGDDLADRRWCVTWALVEALGASVRAHGARLVVSYVPAAFELDEDDWRRTRERWGLDGDGWDVGRVERRLEASCRRSGIPFVDPTAALRASPRRPYQRDDPHWNEAGHHVAALELVPALRGACAPAAAHASAH